MNRLTKAFFASFAAIRFGWNNEAALRQEMILIIAAIPAAFALTYDAWKLLALWGCLAIVLAVEFLNTGIEKLADRITLERDPLIAIVKDCGSAAVLVALVLATGVWSLALWERIFN